MEDDLYASHYAALVRRNWLFVLAVTAIGGLVGIILILFVLPRQYRATTTVLFETTAAPSLALPPSVPGLQALASKFGIGQQSSSAAMMALAFGTSQTVRLDIVDRLDLVREWECPGKFDAEKRLEEATSVTLTDKGTMAIHVAAKGTPRGALPSHDDDLEQRTLARNLANEYVTVIHEMLDTLVLTRSQRKAQFLEERARQARKELEAAREALRKAQSETEFVAPTQTVPPEIGTLATYQKELALAEADQRSAEDELRELKGQLSDEEQMVVSNVVSQRSGIADHLRESVAQAAAELAELRDKGYSDETPECRALITQIEELERAYAEEIDEGLRTQSETTAINPVRMQLLQRVSELEGARAAAAAKVGKLLQAVGELEARVDALPGAMQQVTALMHDVQLKTQVYEAVTSAHEVARAEAAENAPQFSVLDPAVIPPRKIAPSGSRTCLALTFAGFFLGVLAAPAWERRRQRRRARPADDDEPPGDSSPL